MSLLAMIVALGVDALVGWPRRVFRAVGHPVMWLGRLISLCEARFNMARRADRLRRLIGVLTLVFVAGIAALTGMVLQWTVLSAFNGLLGALLVGLVAWPLVAARSLYEHVVAVARPLDEEGDLESARAAVAMIVGRDVTQFDEAGVTRAAIETLAENTSDGVVAPLFWGAVLGLPGIAAYKAINTLDSMIGHRTDRHEAFGWASARIDDLVNLLPARLTALLIALASARPNEAFVAMLRDARKHRSPNAGYPEAAMAGALGVRLSGPRVYAAHASEEPWLNGDARDPNAADLKDALRLYVRTVILLGVFMSGLAAVVIINPVSLL